MALPTQICYKIYIPPQLLKEAMALEVEKITLKNRQLSPKIVKLIEKYTDSPQS